MTPPSSPPSSSRRRYPSLRRRAMPVPLRPLPPVTPDRIDFVPAPARGQSSQVRVVRDATTIVDYTASDIARRADLTVGCITRILSGERQGSVETMDKMAGALSVTVDGLRTFLRKRRQAFETAARARIAAAR